MEIALVEALLGIIGALNLSILGWVLMKQIAQGKEIDRLEKEKVSHESFNETRQDLKTLIEMVTNLRLDLARWEGKAENQEKH